MSLSLCTRGEKAESEPQKNLYFGFLQFRNITSEIAAGIRRFETHTFGVLDFELAGHTVLDALPIDTKNPHRET